MPAGTIIQWNEVRRKKINKCCLRNTGYLKNTIDVHTVALGLETLLSMVEKLAFRIQSYGTLQGSGSRPLLVVPSLVLVLEEELRSFSTHGTPGKTLDSPVLSIEL